MGWEGAELAEARLRGAGKAADPGRALGGLWEPSRDPSSMKVGGRQAQPHLDPLRR